MIFPFVGRLHEGRYVLDGAPYPLGSHGFLRHSETRLVRHSPAEALFELTDNPETFRQYPRRFKLEVLYQLSGATLNTTMKVYNRDDKPLPFALGDHPGFRVPLEAGLAFEDYALDFSGSADCHLMSDKALATGEAQPYPLKNGILLLRHELFDRDAIILTTKARRVRLFSDKGRRSVTLSHPGLPYLGIWHTPNSDAPFVCLEPWLAMPGREGWWRT
jgi:galactose mutarotase-like enzyme